VKFKTAKQIRIERKGLTDNYKRALSKLVMADINLAEHFLLYGDGSKAPKGIIKAGAGK
jgi:hypothetical protein